VLLAGQQSAEFDRIGVTNRGALSPLHDRTTKLAGKVAGGDQIGKAPSDVEAATLITPAVTAHCFDTSCRVSLGCLALPFQPHCSHAPTAWLN